MPLTMPNNRGVVQIGQTGHYYRILRNAPRLGRLSRDTSQWTPKFPLRHRALFEEAVYETVSGGASACGAFGLCAKRQPSSLSIFQAPRNNTYWSAGESLVAA